MLRLLTLGGLDLRDARDEAHPLLAQPKRLGLLVFLATAGPDGVRRRDILLSHFWPELDDVRARGALRQATYVLRRMLGDGALVMRGDDELGTDSAAIWTDALAFESAVDSGDMRAAAELYRGDFLDGFFVSGASTTFDEWVASERQRLRRLAAHAVWTVANELAAHEPTAAVDWIRRTITLAPDDELIVRQALLLLERIGDRSGALQLYHEFCTRLLREYDAQPAAETLAIGEALRRSTAPAAQTTPVDAASPTPVETLTVTPANSASSNKSPRRRSRWKIGAMVGAIALGVAAWSTMQRPLAPAVSAAAPSDELVIGDMHAVARERAIARALTEWLRSSLTRMKVMRIVSRDSLLQALRRAGRDSALAHDAAALRDVAIRNGYETFLASELTPIGKGYLLSGRIIAVTGRELSSATVTASSQDDLIRAVDRLATELRKGSGFSDRNLRPAASLQRVSTPSLQALVSFTQAQDLSPSLGSFSPRVVALLREAIAIDSNFAMAHRRLGMALYNLGLIRESMSELRIAERLVEQLTDVERLMALSSLHGLLGEREQAITEAITWLDVEPKSEWAVFQLAYQFMMLGQYDRAEREIGWRHPSGVTPFWSNIRAYQGRGSDALDSARARFTRLADSVGTRPWREVRSRMAMFHALQYSYDSALAYARADPPVTAGDPLVVAGSLFALGRFDDALRIQRERATSASGEGPPGGTPRVAVESYNALVMLTTGVNVTAARERLATALTDSGFRGRHSVDRHIRPVLALSLAGRAAAARRELDEMESSANADQRAVRAPEFALTRGAVALAEGKTREAIEELTRASGLNSWASQDVCRVCTLPWLARAYEAAGRPDSALLMYERFLTTGDPFRLMADAAWRAVVLQRAAELHRQRMDTTRAIKRLAEFTELWKDADPSLQPAVRRARETLAKLQRATAVSVISPPRPQ